MAIAQPPTGMESAYLGQKKRLHYLLARYAPTRLSGVELYRRLRLNDAFGERADAKSSEAQYQKKLSEDCKRCLSDKERVKATVGQFSQWMMLKGPNYRPNKGFDRHTSEALAFVIADEFEHWQPGRLDEESHKIAYRALADFISSGSGQPAEIFYGLHPGAAEEVTDETQEKIASLDQARRFLRGAPPHLNIVNAGATIKRDAETIDQQSIFDFVTDDSRRMLLITAAAGDGKTTLLFRLARTFFDRGWQTFYKRSNTGLEKFDWPLGRAADAIMMIDRGEEIGNLNRIFDWLAENPRLRVIVAARDMEWRNRNFPTEDGRFKHLFIDRLSDREIGEVAKTIRRFKATDAPASLDEIKVRLAKSVHESRYPHMLATMMSATRAKDFSEILKTMVEHFEPKDILKLTALGGTMRFEDGRPLNCTSNMMWASRATATESLSTGKERFDAIYGKIRSEVIAIGDSRYDLRHPDISQFVLSTFYNGDDTGAFVDLEAIENDLTQFARLVFRLRVLEHLRGERWRTVNRYFHRIPEYWWNSPAVKGHDVGRKLFEELNELLGTAELELSLRATLLQNWMRLERSATDDASVEVRAKHLPILVECLTTLSYRHDDLSAAFQQWFQFALEQMPLGDIEDPLKGTARWVLREWWNFGDGKFRGPSLIALLAKHDTIALGDVNDPQPRTIRRLFRDCWADRQRFGSQYNVYFANAETVDGHIGVPIEQPEPFSARWVYRQAWIGEYRERLCNADTIKHWATLEAERGELGSNLLKPEDYSSRWIFQEAWKEQNRSRLCTAESITHWAELEAENGEFGSDLEKPEDYSSRWIFQETWKEQNRARLCTAESITRWAELEVKKGELGTSLKTPEEYSARWIFQQAWSEENRDRLCSSEFMRRWAKVETAEKGVTGKSEGASDEYSARWIFRQAYQRYSNKLDIRFWDTWIRLEIRERNFGGAPYAAQIYSARWALLERMKLNIEMDESQLLGARIAIGEGNIGDFNNPDPSSARAIFRNLFEANIKIGMVYWAELEQMTTDRSSNVGKKFSAEWIFQTAKAFGLRFDTLDEWIARRTEPEPR
jgi:hypothetical protein